MPSKTLRNDKSIDAQKIEFTKLYAPTTSVGNYASMYQMLPQLRAFWAFSSVDENGVVYDYSGQGRHISPGTSPAYGTSGVLSYADFTRASSQYLHRDDEAGLSITGDLTIGAWVYFDSESSNNFVGILGKWFKSDYSFLLYKTDDNRIRFSVSGDGGTVIYVDDAGANYVADQWYFITGRFTRSNEIALCVNGMWYRKTAGIPASLHDSDQPLYVAMYIDTFGTSQYLDGKLSNGFLCAYAVPQVFIDAIYAHTKAMYMSRIAFARFGTSSSSSSVSSSSSSVSSSSSSTSISSSSTSRSSSSSSTSISSSSTSISSSSSSTSISSSSSSSTSSSSSISSSSSSSSSTSSSSTVLPYLVDDIVLIRSSSSTSSSTTSSSTIIP